MALSGILALPAALKSSRASNYQPSDTEAGDNLSRLLERSKQPMKNFLWDRKRWAPLIIYLALVSALAANREALIYSHLPVLLGTVLYDLILFALILVTFVCIFQEIRCPFATKARVDRAFRQAGLKNGIGQPPSLVAVAADPNKKHGKRYTIRNMGVPIPEMDRKIDSLQRELGAIYEMSYAPKTSLTYLYVLPGKSLLPTIPPTVYDDDF